MLNRRGVMTGAALAGTALTRQARAAAVTPEEMASFVNTGTHAGPLFGVAPTGRKLRFSSCDIFRVRDGQFAEHWGMGDIAGVLAQLRS